MTPNVETVTSHGKTYQRTTEGTFYHEKTAPDVIKVLERARRGGARVRIWCGYTDAAEGEPGLAWMEEYDVCGTIGRSMGPIKIPLLIPNARSLGGGGLLDHCIVAIKSASGWLYRHPTFRVPKIELREERFEAGGKVYLAAATADGEECARFATMAKAERWKAFMVGDRVAK
jgi:hypothetical protein